MKRGLAVLAVVSLPGCGVEHDRSSTRASKARPLVATQTLGKGESARLFGLPGLGVFRAACRGAGRGEVGYRLLTRTASQLITVTGRDGASVTLDPGESFKAAAATPGSPRVDWQVALISAGSIRVADASFSLGRVRGGTGCLVAGRAEVGARGR